MGRILDKKDITEDFTLSYSLRFRFRDPSSVLQLTVVYIRDPQAGHPYLLIYLLVLFYLLIIRLVRKGLLRIHWDYHKHMIMNHSYFIQHFYFFVFNGIFIKLFSRALNLSLEIKILILNFKRKSCNNYFKNEYLNAKELNFIF